MLHMYINSAAFFLFVVIQLGAIRHVHPQEIGGMAGRAFVVQLRLPVFGLDRVNAEAIGAELVIATAIGLMEQVANVLISAEERFVEGR